MNHLFAEPFGYGLVLPTGLIGIQIVEEEQVGLHREIRNPDLIHTLQGKHGDPVKIFLVIRLGISLVQGIDGGKRGDLIRLGEEQGYQGGHSDAGVPGLQERFPESWI